MAQSSCFEMLARFGYGARGAVYVLVAAMALFATFGGGGHGAGTRSALAAVLEQPLGRVWLLTISAGLFAFVAWRFAQSIWNADGHPRSVKGLAVRAGMFTSGLVNVGLALFAASHAIGSSLKGSNGPVSLTAWLFSQPFGRYLVGLVGICIIGAGVAQMIKGLTHGFRKYLNLPDSTFMDGICLYGLAARGTVFLIVGAFFVYAAYAVDPQEAGTLTDALRWVRQLPFGGSLYAAVAVGLLAFGLYGFIEARYRRITAPSTDAVLRKTGN
jgi:hypothetical protein